MPSDFFQTHFVDPIIYNQGYNIYNTIAYAILLIGGVLLAYKLLQKLKIPVDKKFFIGIIPFIALGGVLRSLEDLLEATGATQSLLNSPIKDFILIDAVGNARNLLLITPLMYITLFIVALFSLLLAIGIQRKLKIEYYKTWAIMGTILILATLSQMRIENSTGMLMMLGITLFWGIVIFGAGYLTKNNEKIQNFLSTENKSILFVHLFDATTTFVSLSYFNYFEQHVLTGFLINLFGPWIMFPLKLIVVSFVLYVLDKEMVKEKEQEQKNFLKIIILILGLGPGLRNFLRLVMGV